MEYIRSLIDFVLHIDRHLDTMIQTFGPWMYVILFLIIFAETGLVVTPILPGDSLLFAIGALAARPDGLNLTLLLVLLPIAAILGDGVNYWIGMAVGPRVFRWKESRWFNPRHLERTHAFYEKYGGKTIIIARFMPIIRTFAPFVAGMGRMNYARFTAYNISGGLIWIFFFVILGYFFGNLPAVKKHFTLVIMVIIVLSMMPPVIEYLRHRFSKKPAQPS
jgi:membrane-associated protein